MANLKPIIDYSSKDYEAFRNDMINLIPYKLPEYTDTSQSDAGIAIVELAAYGFDILSYYLDRTANEVYLGTATQRRSVIDITKQYGYRLKNAIPSSTSVVFTLSAVQVTDFIIPKGFIVSTEETPYEEPINFETTADLTIPKGTLGNEKDVNGNYLYKATAVQGLTILNEILGASNGQPLQFFPLRYPDVIDGSTEVSVNEGAGYEIWTNVTAKPIGSTSDGRQYITETDENGFTQISFGDGLSGKIPAILGTDNIKASYRVGGGIKTNVGTNTIIKLVTNIAGIASVTNSSAAIGGVDKETLREAKANAPKLFKTQNRAVTGDDYEAISRSVAGVAKAKATVDSVLLNTVHVTIAPIGGGQPTTTLINSVFQLLDDSKTITTQVLMDNPKYINSRITLDAVVNTDISRAETRTYLIESLKALLHFNIREFGQGLPISRIYREIMSINGLYSTSIKRVTISPLIEWTSVTGNPIFNNVITLSTNTYDGLWKVVMTSATAFTVSQLSYDANKNEILVAKGTGTFGTLFTSTGNEISFTITAGTVACAINDSWKFKTTPYLADITIDSSEILLLDEADLVINLTGGRE